MSDYSRQLVVGPLVGFRTFRVYQDKLYGPMRGGAFAAVGNVASHEFSMLADFEARQAAWLAANQELNMYPPASLMGGRPLYADSCRGVASVRCGCGYYACFNPVDAAGPHYNMGAVAGIVSGYGVCTVGDLGFRAEKADLLALIKPPTNVLDYLSAEYADVPVFGSFMAAVREFPLSEGVAA